MLLYSIYFVLCVNVYNLSMDLIGAINVCNGLQVSLVEDTQHAHFQHANVRMFGLARVQLRVALHISNNNNSALLMFE